VSASRVYRYVRGGDPRFVPYRPRIAATNPQLEALRMRYPGSTGRPPRGFPGGLEAIAKIMGCSKRTVSRRLLGLAEREDRW
jgi:hypothetical protein